MEYIDITDESGKLTGEVRSRTDVHRLGLWHRTVHVWVINSFGELILQKRARFKESNPGRWTISACGHIAAGQTSLDAALQEVREELGLVITTSQLNYLFSVNETSAEGSFIRRETQDVYLVNLDYSIDDFVLQKEEVDEVKGVPYAELEKLLVSEPRSFSDHTEEYAKLFSYLNTQHYETRV
jgi:isopentenyl-diphosphate delta-isomerase